MKILTQPVGQMKSNCYLIITENNDCLIIDPGDDADYIERIITEKKAKPLKIIATHGHFDHIMAATELMLAYNIPFHINKKDDFLVKNMSQSAAHFLGIKTDPPPIPGGFLKDKEIIKADDYEIRIIATRGHTPGSICLYIPQEKSLFTGDTLFAQGGIGRTDFSYSKPAELQKSLKLIFSLPGETIIRPGHGEESTLAKEKRFLM